MDFHFFGKSILKKRGHPGEIYVENSVSAVLPAHSAVMSRLGLYLVEGKVARE